MSVALLCLPTLLLSQQADSNRITAEEFMAKLAPRSGTVVISNGLATLQVPPAFRYIDAAASKRLLTEAWGILRAWPRASSGCSIPPTSRRSIPGRGG